MSAALEETAIKRPEVRVRSVRQPIERLRAPFSLRCGAILIDYIVIVGILAFSTLISRMFGGGARSAGSSSETFGIVVAIVAAFLNLGVLAGFTGRTIGKWATGLRIERVSGAELGIGRALLRNFVGYLLSSLLLGLGFIAAAFTSRGRALHDLLAGTVVVREAPATIRRS